ncbi:MAG: CinA family protein [SAR324 cluster bacterium]|nr:CinA family protein [SAR324 cluster bacterium]
MEHQPHDLKHTAFFPLTGNPTGFHHLLLAECVLHQFPEIQRIVFILSNGKHPDPTKEQTIADKQVRFEILEKALQEFNNPQKSHAAKIAQQTRIPLKLNPKNAFISTVEFSHERPLRLYEHFKMIQHALPEDILYPMIWIIGGDLIQRMSNSEIFSNSDIQSLSRHGKFLVAPRGEYEIQKTVSQLLQTRQISLKHQEIQLEPLPHELHVFLQLSSTMIRTLTQTQHNLVCCLPAGAAELIYQYKPYHDRSITHVVSEWEHQCRLQEQKLDQLSCQLKEMLDRFADQDLPHTLALVETSTGGRLAATLTSSPGFSKHFKESVVVYDQEGKNRLLKRTVDESAVSSKMVMELGKKYQQQTGADFVLSETGMAGPVEGMRRSNKQGLCYFAYATATTVQSVSFQSNPFFSKKEHQLIFAGALLEWFISLLDHEEIDGSNNNSPFSKGSKEGFSKKREVI